MNPRLAVAIAALSVGCGQATAPAPSGGESGQRYTRSDAVASTLPEPVDLAVELTAVDPATGVAGTVAGAVRADGPWSGRLAVVFADVGVPATAYRELLREFARGGLHALALPSPLSQPVATICGGDSLCSEASRAEGFDGTDRTAKVAIKYADSVKNRVTMVVLHLAKGGQGWGQFVVGGAPKWSSIVAVGHGDGAGQAAWAGLHVSFDRVALLAGPTDGDQGAPVAWLASNGKTPSVRWRAFAHTADPAAARLFGGWTALGLGAGAASWPSVDQGAVFGPQGLTTSTPSPDPRGAVAIDPATPRDQGGKPRFRATWRYLVDGAP